MHGLGYAVLVLVTLPNLKLVSIAVDHGIGRDDGSIMNYDAYHAWIDPEPDGDEECGRLAANGNGWAGRKCDKGYDFICTSGKFNNM